MAAERSSLSSFSLLALTRAIRKLAREDPEVTRYCPEDASYLLEFEQRAPYYA